MVLWHARLETAPPADESGPSEIGLHRTFTSIITKDLKWELNISFLTKNLPAAAEEVQPAKVVVHFLTTSESILTSCEDSKNRNRTIWPDMDPADTDRAQEHRMGTFRMIQNLIAMYPHLDPIDRRIELLTALNTLPAKLQLFSLPHSLESATVKPKPQLQPVKPKPQLQPVKPKPWPASPARLQPPPQPRPASPARLQPPPQPRPASPARPQPPSQPQSQTQPRPAGSQSQTQPRPAAPQPPSPRPAAQPSSSPSPRPAAQPSSSPSPRPAAQPSSSPSPQPAPQSPSPQPACKPSSSQRNPWWGTRLANFPRVSGRPTRRASVVIQSSKCSQRRRARDRVLALPSAPEKGGRRRQRPSALRREPEAESPAPEKEPGGRKRPSAPEKELEAERPSASEKELSRRVEPGQRHSFRSSWFQRHSFQPATVSSATVSSQFPAPQFPAPFHSFQRHSSQRQCPAVPETMCRSALLAFSLPALCPTPVGLRRPSSPTTRYLRRSVRRPPEKVRRSASVVRPPRRVPVFAFASVGISRHRTVPVIVFGTAWPPQGVPPPRRPPQKAAGRQRVFADAAAARSFHVTIAITSHTKGVSLKLEVSAEQDGRASGADEATVGVLEVQPDAVHRDPAEPPHPGLTGAAGRNCCTSDNKTLWTCCMQTQQAPTAHHPSPRQLGRSDHNLVHLRPVYTPMVKRQPPNKRRVKQWSEGGQRCTEGLNQPCPPRGYGVSQTTKPWVTPDLRALLLEKGRAFQSGDRDN
ncbi:hypothetical protein L3Q82_020958 [Scortum barcoo]|uniref:Uncharacterized protein n=1 Tax=Scortum barcoo TaxID=214431 RepID=A0ACB8VB94_9TELE|nr:hypothetical protein L3Q82_020958 [Scortum barcoo]